MSNKDNALYVIDKFTEKKEEEVVKFLDGLSNTKLTYLYREVAKIMWLEENTYDITTKLDEYILTQIISRMKLINK